jgi:predicted transcriptional regulator
VSIGSGDNAHAESERPKMTLTEQAAAFLAARLAGRSFREIAEEYHTTPEEVRRLSRMARPQAKLSKGERVKAQPDG